MPRFIFEIANEITKAWPKPKNSARPFLKAMQYLCTVEDRLADGGASTIIRNFIANAKDWQGVVADRLKAELRDLLASPNIGTPSPPAFPDGQRPPLDEAPAAACTFCGAGIEEAGGFVNGRHISGKQGIFCPSCHFFSGIGFGPDTGQLYRRFKDGNWHEIPIRESGNSTA